MPRQSESAAKRPLRVLHLTPELPCWPGGTGGSTRQYHLLRRVVELGHEVTVVAPVAPAQAEATGGLTDAGVRLIPYERPASRVLEASHALRRQPALASRALTMPVLGWQVSVFWTAMREAALELTRSWRPDVVSVDHDSAAHWIQDLPPELPAVLTFHNVSWAYYASRARSGGRWRAPLHRLESRRFRRHDLASVRRYQGLIAMSEREADELRRATRQTVEVIQNGVASWALTPSPEPKGPPALIFTGTMNHPPNAEGIAWFARGVWPQVRAAVPKARLLVVGREPPAAVRALDGRDGIEVTGGVLDVAPQFARSVAAVAPLLSGGGTRLKILEAFAAGRAVIATAVAAEGLDVRPGEDLLVEDRADAFARACITVLGDAALRARLAARGREAAESRYDWRALGERFASVLDDVASGTGAGAAGAATLGPRNFAL